MNAFFSSINSERLWWKHHDHGFSAIDCILALSLLLMFVAVFSLGTIEIFRTRTLITTTLAAQSLAVEGLEASRIIRDEDFLQLTDGDHGLFFSGERWSFQDSNDNDGFYTRSVHISSISPESKLVTVTIDWSNDLRDDQTLSQSTILTNWRVTLPE